MCVFSMILKHKDFAIQYDHSSIVYTKTLILDHINTYLLYVPCCPLNIHRLFTVTYINRYVNSIGFVSKIHRLREMTDIKIYVTNMAYSSNIYKHK